MKTNQNFSQELFRRITGANTWDVNHYPGDHDLQSLMDHGFIADLACVWDDRLEGHEIAIVARTYADDALIDNPPDGLRIIRLPAKFMGPDDRPDISQAIAIVIESKSPSAEAVLTCCTRLPADMLAYAISADMKAQGYAILLDICHEPTANSPAVKIIKAFGSYPWISTDVDE